MGNTLKIVRIAVELSAAVGNDIRKFDNGNYPERAYSGFAGVISEGLRARQRILQQSGIGAMLAFAEDYLRRIRAATNDNEIIAIIALLAAELGYRSGYLIEYSSELKSAGLVLDSNSWRSGWWDYYEASGLRPGTRRAAAILANDHVQYVNETRFSDPRDPLLAFARRVDMVNAAMVPINVDSEVAGLVAFCGERVLSSPQEVAVQFLCYSLFSQSRSFLADGIRIARANLTPREREVMALTSEGLTAQDVADQLGMSPRTVNQHMDNVAGKLGTRNRVHSVAEAIRRDLL